MRFYDQPLNYFDSRSPVKVSDNRYNTNVTDTTVVVNIDSVGDLSGAARSWDTIYIRGHNITSFAVANLITAVMIPANTSSPGNTPLDIDGQQSYIYRRSTPVHILKQLSFTFTYGTGGYLSQLMILKTLVDLSDDSFNGYLTYEINPQSTGRMIESAAKRKSWIPPLLDTRDLREVSLRLRFNQHITEHTTQYKNLRQLMQSHRGGFVLEPDWDFHPEFCAPCLFPNASRQLRFLSRVKSSGRTVNLTVSEM